MASRSQVKEPMTLEEFFTLPVDEHPYLEFIDGRVEAKVSPQKKHSRITARLVAHMNGFAEPAKLGSAWPELRCTFSGRSIVPDVVFLTFDHIPADDSGAFENETPIPPDIHVEIVSPDQSVKQAREKLSHSTSNGTALGWLIDPEKKTIDVFRPGRPAERLGADDALDGGSILPGYRLPVAEVFGWLIIWPRGEGRSGAARE